MRLKKRQMFSQFSNLNNLVILTLGTFLGYFIYYSYMSGKYWVLKIPNGFVDFSMMNAIFGLFIIIGVLLNYLVAGIKWSPLQVWAFSIQVIILNIFNLMILNLILFGNNISKVTDYTLGIFTFSGLFIWIITEPFSNFLLKSYKKMKEHNQSMNYVIFVLRILIAIVFLEVFQNPQKYINENLKIINSLQDINAGIKNDKRKFSFYSKIIAEIILVISVFIIIPWSVGIYTGKNLLLSFSGKKSSFIVKPNNNESYLVFGMYKENMLCKKFDSNLNVIDLNSTRLLNANSFEVNIVENKKIVVINQTYQY